MRPGLAGCRQYVSSRSRKQSAILKVHEPFPGEVVFTDSRAFAANWGQERGFGGRPGEPDRGPTQR